MPEYSSAKVENLIEGKLSEVVPFLDKLSASDGSWREVMKCANSNFALTSNEDKIRGDVYL